MSLFSPHSLCCIQLLLVMTQSNVPRPFGKRIFLKCICSCCYNGFIYKSSDDWWYSTSLDSVLHALDKFILYISSFWNAKRKKRVFNFFIEKIHLWMGEKKNTCLLIELTLNIIFNIYSDGISTQGAHILLLWGISVIVCKLLD